MDDPRTWTAIETLGDLAELLGEPNERAADKGRQALLDVDRAWLAAAEVEPSGTTVQQLDDYYEESSYSRGLYTQ